MRLLNDLYYASLYLGRPASLSYMIYGALNKEPVAFLEGMFGALTINHLYKTEKQFRINHKPSQEDQ